MTRKALETRSGWTGDGRLSAAVRVLNPVSISPKNVFSGVINLSSANLKMKEGAWNGPRAPFARGTTQLPPAVQVANGANSLIGFFFADRNMSHQA